MRQANQLTSFLARTIAVLVLTTFVSTTARADASGTCGDPNVNDGQDVTWSYVESTHTLTISGSGAMMDYYSYPWNAENANIKTVVIGSGVTSIGKSAFGGCTSLSSVTISSSVTSIGTDAFSSCYSLSSVTIPSSVTSIGDGAFSFSTSLSSINVDPSNGAFKSENGVLFSKDGTKLVCYPGGKSGDYAIPSGVTSIGNQAFVDCAGLSSVTIPSSVTSIGNYAFFRCTSLSSVIIPSSVTSIGTSAFHNCTSLSSITIPSSVTSIGGNAFNSCKSLTSVTIPSSVTSIGINAFLCCTNLKKVYVLRYDANAESPGTKITTLGEYVFEISANLEIFVPSDALATYKAASNWSFYDNNIRGFNGYCGDTNKNGGKDLIWILSDENNDGTSETLNIMKVGSTGAMADYDAFNPVGWNNDKNNITSIVIEDGVTHIGNAAFFACNNASLTSTIPSSVTSIGQYAFQECKSLSSVTFSDGVKTIGNQAFKGCIGLTSLTIPTSVTSIGDQAFNGCSGLTTVTIGSGLTSIADEAFKDCTNLTTFTLYALSCTLGSSAFNGCNNIHIYVFEDKVTDYEIAVSWKYYSGKIAAIPDLKVNDAGEKGHWCSYYNELADVTVSNMTTIYTAKYNSTTQKVTLTQVDGNIVKKGEAVLLKNTMGWDITLSSAASSGSGDYSDNELKGGTTVTAGYDAYTLSRGADGNGDMGFYKFNGASLDGSKAHLELPQSSPSPARGFIGFDDETTGISDASHLMDNGEWIMDNEAGAWYDLSGRKLAGQPTKKGIYVRDGRKVVIR